MRGTETNIPGGTCIVLQFSSATLTVYARFQRSPVGMHNLLLVPVLEAPEVVVPSKVVQTSCPIIVDPEKVGQIPYASKVTQREEQLPFVVGVMGLPGEYLNLINPTST